VVVLGEVEEGFAVIVVFGEEPVVWEGIWRKFFVANPTLNATEPFEDLAAANCLKKR